MEKAPYIKYPSYPDHLPVLSELPDGYGGCTFILRGKEPFYVVAAMPEEMVQGNRESRPDVNENIHRVVGVIPSVRNCGSRAQVFTEGIFYTEIQSSLQEEKRIYYLITVGIIITKDNKLCLGNRKLRLTFPGGFYSAADDLNPAEKLAQELNEELGIDVDEYNMDFLGLICGYKTRCAFVYVVNAPYTSEEIKRQHSRAVHKDEHDKLHFIPNQPDEIVKFIKNWHGEVRHHCQTELGIDYNSTVAAAPVVLESLPIYLAIIG